ncbi:MAG TPA: hypothetical protein VIC28_02215 [Thermoanaerobaculia bacterium]
MRLKISLCLALLGLLGFGGQALAVINAADPVPAATLLVPYFEVDLNNVNGVNTLFSINNASATAILAHVTVWSDQSIPVLDFDVYLTGFDVQTVNLRDILQNGNLPVTASAGQDPAGGSIGTGISPKGIASQDINFASCTGTLPYNNPALNAAFRAHLQAVLQGNASPTFGLCYGSKTKDNVLRGYVTIDAVNSCNVLFPSQMLTGYSSVITNQNVLWGDVFYVNSAENFAQGETLVHIEACATCFVPGDHTFYGRYDNATAVDAREALPTTMAARYLNGGGFTGGTDFIVWREGGTQTSAVGYSCNLQGPLQWYPLGATQVVVFDETEQPETSENCPSGFDCGIDILIPNEAQRVDVGTDIPTPFNFGWVWLNLQNPDFATFGPYGDPFSQMWMFTVMDASGRFSVGFNGIAIDNANTPNSIFIPVN